MVQARGWGEAGYANLATIDDQVNVQVKQCHECSLTPFYQPLMSLNFLDA